MLVSRPNIDILVIYFFIFYLVCTYCMPLVVTSWTCDFFYATSWKIKWLNCEIQSSYFSEAFYRTTTLNVKANKVNSIKIICNWDLVWFPPDPSDHPNCQRPTTNDLNDLEEHELPDQPESHNLSFLMIASMSQLQSSRKLRRSDEDQAFHVGTSFCVHMLKTSWLISVGYRNLTLIKLSNWVVM